MACTNAAEMERFWTEMFDGKAIFRGQMLRQPFVRMIVCGVTLVFREDPDFEPPPGPGAEFAFRNHLGLRVVDLEAAMADLESRGAQFVLTPARIKEMQQAQTEGTPKYLETNYIAPPLTRERIDAGEYGIDLAIMVGPDNLWIELNQIKEPQDTQWFPGQLS